jgi:hypothetical protein
MPEVKWSPVLGTRNWTLENEHGIVVRHLLVCEPDAGEMGNTRFEVTGKGHGRTVHSSFYEARAAAEASL